MEVWRQHILGNFPPPYPSVSECHYLTKIAHFEDKKNFENYVLKIHENYDTGHKLKFFIINFVSIKSILFDKGAK